MDIIEFAKTIGKLKTIPRTGWVREGVEKAENVADHSFRTAVLAMILGPKLDVDSAKLVKMALIHDVGEITTSDIVVDRGENIDRSLKLEKEKKEALALKEIFGFTDIKNEVSSLYEEMIEQQTKEAVVMKQLDKLEMAIQALEYEQEQGKRLDEFFVNAKLYMREPLFKELLVQVLKQRPTYD